MVSLAPKHPKPWLSTPKSSSNFSTRPGLRKICVYMEFSPRGEISTRVEKASWTRPGLKFSHVNDFTNNKGFSSGRVETQPGVKLHPGWLSSYSFREAVGHWTCTKQSEVSSVQRRSRKSSADCQEHSEEREGNRKSVVSVQNNPSTKRLFTSWTIDGQKATQYCSNISWKSYSKMARHE